MSSAGAAVLFPDGEIRYGIYHGTSDIMHAALFEFTDEAWDSWRDGRSRDSKVWPRARSLWDKGEATEEFEVTIYSDYGGGWTYKGTATKTCITSSADCWDDDTYPTHVNGRPSWVVWKNKSESLVSE